MRTLTIRILSLVACLVVVTYVLGSPAVAKDNPVGNWTGVVIQKQRNIAVTLKVSSLQIGSISGTMRWGSPRVCSLQTEYSGMRDARYTFNIAGSNGGWCDLYRDGSLSLEMHNEQPQSLRFTLANKQGDGLVEGQLATEP